jgi:hypothetical protein
LLHRNDNTCSNCKVNNCFKHCTYYICGHLIGMLLVTFSSNYDVSLVYLPYGRGLSLSGRCTNIVLSINVNVIPRLGKVLCSLDNSGA